MEHAPKSHGEQKLHDDILYDVAKGFLDQRDTAALSQTSRSMRSQLTIVLYKRDILAVKARDEASGVFPCGSAVCKAARFSQESQNSTLARKHREFPRHFDEKPPALHWACMIGSVPMVNQIIDYALAHYSQYLDCKDIFSRTALFLAVDHGHIEIARLLVKAGCYVDAAVQTTVCINKYLSRNSIGYSSFDYVISRPYWKQDTGNLQEATPLAFAITNGKTAIAEMLAHHTRRPYVTCTEHGLVSVLDLASMAGMVEVVRILLIREMTPSTDQVENHHKSAYCLHFAALRDDNREIMELLVNFGASHTSEDNNDKAPLRWAIHNSNISNAIYLIGLEERDYSGERLTTALAASSKKDYNLPITQQLVEHFISQGCIGTIESSTSVCLTRGEQAPLTTQYMFHQLAVEIPKKTWKRNQTYLHWALSQPNITEDVLQAFVDQCLWQADVNAKDSEGNTALYYAKKLKHKSMVKLLKKHGGEKN